MSTGLFLFLVVLAAAAGWLLRLAFLERWRRLESVVRDMADGKNPSTFIFRGSRRFTRLAADLERLSREQQRLRELSTERGFNLDTILSSMVEGVMVVDEKQVIQSVNESLLRLFEIRSRPEQQTVLGALRDASVEAIVRETLQTGEPVSRDISPVALPGRHLAASAVPIRDPDGAIGGAVVIFHDMTRLRQLEEIRREFVANISHELRTPLSIFQGYLENLIDNPGMSRREVASNLAVMKKHSMRLNALIEDVLTLARLESRTEKFKLVPTDLDPLLNQAARDWRRAAAKKNIALNVEAAPGTPQVMADEVRIEQVLNNLLDNAIKYTNEGGKVSLSAAAEGNGAVLRCADTGIGIPPADLPRIFERFYRVEKARSRETGGTGLGLSIVKHILTLHGGTVEVESTFGRGTVFTLRFPGAESD